MNRHNSLSQSQRTAISLVFAFCLPMLASAVAGVARPQLSAAHRHQILSLASNLMSTNPSLAAVSFARPSLRKIPLCHITPLLHLLPSLPLSLSVSIPFVSTRPGHPPAASKPTPASS
jgi:hypothetical protein